MTGIRSLTTSRQPAFATGRNRRSFSANGVAARRRSKPKETPAALRQARAHGAPSAQPVTLNALRLWWCLLGLLCTGCAHGLFHVHCDNSQTKRSTGPQELQITTTSLNRYRPQVKSWKTFKTENVVMQQYDYSRGAAALTTMVVYYFEDEMTEQHVLDAIFERLNRSPESEKVIEDRIENGLSMLDLQQVAADLGYQSAVAKINMDQVRKLEAPVLIRIIKDDFRHFVVLRGIVEDRVYLADPIRGNIRISEREFRKQWNGVALFLGKAGFGLPKEHPLAIRAASPGHNELQAARRHIFSVMR